MSLVNHLSISVVICAHNPRPDFFKRVLNALKCQTLDSDHWELILIDNASSVPLGDNYDLGWQLNSRHIIERELGLTPARLRGIEESIGQVIVFVDDDNVIESNYLQGVLSISTEFPYLGTWGAAHIIPEYECEPDTKHLPYTQYLTLREQCGDEWSNSINHWPSVPLGAGLCVRKQVATRYRDVVRQDVTRLKLDRKGQSLDGAGDVDLALTSRDLGLGWGTFDRLKLLHLMSSGRVKEEYLLRLVRASIASHVILNAKLGKLNYPITSWPKTLIKSFYILLRQGVVAMRFHRQFQLGIKEGYAKLAEF